MLTKEDLPKIQTPWSSLGYITFKRTYARPLNDGTNNTEEFEDTILRVINACETQLLCGFTREEEDRLAEYFLSLKCSVAGRFLWTLGTDTVSRFGLASLQNCAFVVEDHPIIPFTWTMDMLALGAGVGYNIQHEYVDKLPSVKEWFKAPTRVDDPGADFIIPDSREGWCRFLGKMLKAAFLSDSPKKGTFTYSTQVIRGKGAPIKGFGGTACLTGDTILRTREGLHITISELYDCYCDNSLYMPKIESLSEQHSYFYLNWTENVIDNGLADVFEIITETNLTIKATANHRFMIQDGSYKELSNFEIGDFIAVCIDDELVFDTIKNIAYYDCETVYDIQMKGPDHNFIANDFVSHNSGPEDLCWGINKIAELLIKRKGKRVRPIDCLDIMNIIGWVVVAGNVRRSAQICLFDGDDVEMLLAKRFDMGGIPSWRAMSNNTAVCNDLKDLHDYFWDSYIGKGEPIGLLNLDLCRKVGRLGETEYPDPDIKGVNPLTIAA